jgi:putative ABC transport system permease protein
MIHLRLAFRSIARTPGFLIAVVLTLALGTGASSAVFSVVYGVLYRPLPYRAPDRLVMVWETRPRNVGSTDPVAAALSRKSFVFSRILQRWRAENREFDAIAGYKPAVVALSGPGYAERVEGLAATAPLFDTLGVRPLLGRTFTSDEDRPGANAVVVLGHGLWASRFNRDPKVLGRQVLVDGANHTVIGVMPADLAVVLPHASRTPALFIPMSHTYVPGRDWTVLLCVARLKPGVTLAGAQAGLSALTTRLAEGLPQYRERGVRLVALAEEIGEGSRQGLLVLFGATGCLLLIACVNVANLLMVRATVRHRELAVCSALGAGRRRLVAQMLAESVALAGIGGFGGLLVALWGTDLLLALVPHDLFPRLEDVHVDVAVLSFNLAVSLVVGILAGLGPAWHALGWDRRGRLLATLQNAMPTASSGRAQRFVRRTLVTIEVAAATVLLVGAGLLARTYVGLGKVDLGVAPERLLSFDVSMPEAVYPTDAARVALADRLLQSIKAVPGVEQAALTNSLPVRSRFTASTAVSVSGRPPLDNVEVRTVSAGFFSTGGIRVLYGRGIQARDSTADVVVINHALVRKLWPLAPSRGPEPIGELLMVGSRQCRVVGVIGDVRYDGPASEVTEEAYVPYAQWPTTFVSVLLRVNASPATLLPALRTAVRNIDPNLPVQSVATMEQTIAETVAPPRFRLAAMSMFAGLAVVLAVIGLFGVTAQSVALRRHEIGIRIACGAGRAAIGRMVVVEGMLLGVVGVAAGIAVALAAGRVLAAYLFGITAADATTYVSVAGTLLAVAILATIGPAVTATRVDPVGVLRKE